MVCCHDCCHDCYDILMSIFKLKIWLVIKVENDPHMCTRYVPCSTSGENCACSPQVKTVLM